MNLPVSIYSAYKGYSWSLVPDGMDVTKLNNLYRMIANLRGDFPDPLAVEAGFVSDGEMAAAFVIQTVDKWDAEGRTSDYGAFAFFPVSVAAEIDYVTLINSDFFWTPTRTPIASVEYKGEPSVEAPASISKLLKKENRGILENPRMLGSMLASAGANSNRWVGLMQPDNVLYVECDKWHK